MSPFPARVETAMLTAVEGVLYTLGTVLKP